MPYRSSGFTLLEILTVLFIIGMTAAIVGPRLPLMKDRMEFAMNRDTLEQNLGNLSYEAFRDNRDYVLKGTFDSNGLIESKSSEPQETEGERRLRSAQRTLPGEAALLPPVAPVVPKLKIPPEWQVVVTEPIYFFASGFCRGGRLDVIVGGRKFPYRLVPPTCALEAE